MSKIVLTLVAVMFLAGCATSTRYDRYTSQHFPSKDEFFVVNVYPESQPLSADNPYYVIGKVSVEGLANSISAAGLANKAKKIARKKGADAIINAKTEVYDYFGDDLLRFKGELIVYAPAVSQP